MRHPLTRVVCSRLLALAVAGAALLSLPAPAAAQPFGAWLTANASNTGRYVSVPHSADLNPTDAITIEAWVSITSTGCRSIVGKGYTTSYWVGICGSGTLRSYLAGSASIFDGGTIPLGPWTHIAVTYDGANRRHYINGELVATLPETGALPGNSNPVRISSDVDYDFPPTGAIDEVRLWNVARTIDQIRSSINVPITAAQPGLVAVWPLDGSGADALGAHSGSTVGGVTFLDFAVVLNCAPSATSLCLNGRFSVRVSWRDSTGTTGVGTVVPGASADSGIFWFFSPNAWEVLAKSVNGCGFNNRYWAFGAATTDVFYRLEFLDVRAGANKIYFNYPGVPSPAITDAAAFATCP